MSFIDDLKRLQRDAEHQLRAMEEGTFKTREKRPGNPEVDTTEQSKEQVRKEIEDLRRIIEQAESAGQ
jgi:CTP-dependent riboflavin kinase